MLASKVTQETLENAAAEIGVTVVVTPLSNTGLRHRVKVNPGEWKDEDGDRKYQRESNSGRRIAAVCWHGFRDYFRAVFEIVPTAKFTTVLDTWDGSEDFEDRFVASGYKNWGSMYAPMYACEACRCPDRGRAE